ncbi:hypothetical protein APHNP_0437 [Anaplasma phagocytophilum str. ApNP]|uniref:Lipoprotein n=1 Tax=Anaplasma phagocytophilum str. ApNP TaxID=1359153 RepID=A0A0F3NJU6_ANAPH|nr:hypothetical protein APHNP_0437 [Anaplasma phagocytophilum str. ApNP]
MHQATYLKMLQAILYVSSIALLSKKYAVVCICQQQIVLFCD